MWYNPVTNPNGRLRHVLGAFFPLYASMSKENQDSISEVRAFRGRSQKVVKNDNLYKGRNCQRSGVGGQKKPKTCQPSL